MNTLDGSGTPAKFILRRPGTVRRISDQSPAILHSELDAFLEGDDEEIWLVNRALWQHLLGHPPVRFEQTVREVATIHGMGFRGFTGNTEREPRNLDAYETVCDDPTLTTYQATRRA